MLERPRDTVALFDERVGVFLGDKSRDTCPSQVAHHNQRLPGRAFDVQLRDFPRGSVIFRGISRGADVPHVTLQVSVLEANEAPSVFVTALIRCADRTDPYATRCSTRSPSNHKPILPAPVRPGNS